MRFRVVRCAAAHCSPASVSRPPSVDPFTVTISRVTDGGSGRRMPGYVIGSIVAIGFGLGFIAGNSGSLHDPWPLIVRVAGGLAAAALLVATFRARASAGPPTPAESVTRFVGRGYAIVVAAEAAALFGGLAVINGVLHRTDVSVAWVALVVGVHFYGLGYVWRMPMYHGLATGMTALALAGFVIYAAGGPKPAIDVVSGVGSGVALYLAVVWTLTRGRRTT
jgi:hypothetical protein